MDLELSGCTVLITGGSKGIGRAVADGFAAQGCSVHLVARTASDLEAAAVDIRAGGARKVTLHPMDLSDSANVAKLLDRAGDADIVVNNAGAIPGGDLDAVDEDTWRSAWDLKVFGYINMTRAFYARMRSRGAGVIVNVIGLAGERPSAGYVAGSAGNASLMAFTRAVGSTSLEHGVRVVAVNPGPVETDRLVTLMRTRAQAEHGDPERWREYLSGLPMGRAAYPGEVADLVLFLASPRASYISGAVVTLDGGLSSRQG